MRFIDANVFLYSYLTRATPSSDEKLRRRLADKILTQVDGGERVVTSVVHLSEVANVLEDRMPLQQQTRLFESILLNKFIEVKEVTKELYSIAVSFSADNKIGINDALAVILMQRENITGIYSFDSDFDDILGITRLIE